MDDMNYFIKHFVQKERQDRWLYLMHKSWEKFFDNLGQMERQLKENCHLIQNNSIALVQQIIHEKGISTGVYYGSGEQGVEISLTNLEQSLIEREPSFQGSFIVCRTHCMGFYLHHEGWIYVCGNK